MEKLKEKLTDIFDGYSYSSEKDCRRLDQPEKYKSVLKPVITDKDVLDEVLELKKGIR